jgi:glycosyltransferase involved in cell wall biosynthesis
LSARRIEVIPNGLDTDVFKPIDKSVAKAYFGLPPGDPVLLFGAQFLTDRRKGGDLLVEALEQIDFRCTLLVFGIGDLSVGTGGPVTVKTVGSLNDDISLAMTYSAADVFVCPSREDNLPNTVAEALACATPCVAFDVNGLREMIEHRKNGWLARPFDSADLGAGIRWVATHPNREQLARAARDKALAEYGLERMSERYARLYAELLTSHRP